MFPKYLFSWLERPVCPAKVLKGMLKNELVLVEKQLTGWGWKWGDGEGSGRLAVVMEGRGVISGLVLAQTSR